MNKARILIVEDETIIGMEIEIILRTIGYQVTSIVDTSDEAIKKAETDKPDLILMDIRIKGDRDGIETAEIIRERFGIPIIFSTAYLDEERIQRAKLTMPFGYVLKPIQERDLKVTIEMALYVAKVDFERKKNEEWLATTLKSIGDAVIATDTDSKVTLLNPVGEALTGWKQAEAIGKPLNDIFHIICEQSGESIQNPVEKVLKEEKIVGLANHTILISKDGKEIPIDDSAAPIKGVQGEITGVVLVFRDVSERKQAEMTLLESESRVKHKLEALLSPESHIGSLKLSDLIDTQEIQSMMDDFFHFSNFFVAMLDIDGTVVVSSGWQDICTKFHRVHPETARFCIESDAEFSKGGPQGVIERYKCKNNLWVLSTPIIVEDKHMGNIYFGQFFYDDETIDEELFIAQAKKYGFNQADYLDALHQVPRFDKSTVDHLVSFFSKFASSISKQAYRNFIHAKALSQKSC